MSEKTDGTGDARIERSPQLTASAPDDHLRFRLAQLVILIDEIAPPGRKGAELERLGYYDFFAANPFAVFSSEDHHERARLHLAGFDERPLNYASTGSRFANRRKKLQHDVAFLISYGLVEPHRSGYVLTSHGRDLAHSFNALYADQYRESVALIHERFRRLSNYQLMEAAREWLSEPSLLLDLYGTVEDTDSEGDAVAGAPFATVEPSNDATTAVRMEDTDGE